MYAEILHLVAFTYYNVINFYGLKLHLAQLQQTRQDFSFGDICLYLTNVNLVL